MKDKIVESIGQVDLSGMVCPAVAVYKSPKDYPGKCVGRVFDINRPTDTVILKDTVEEIYWDIQEHTEMTFFERLPWDDEKLVGTWI